MVAGGGVAMAMVRAKKLAQEERED